MCYPFVRVGHKYLVAVAEFHQSLGGIAGCFKVAVSQVVFALQPLADGMDSSNSGMKNNFKPATNGFSDNVNDLQPMCLLLTLNMSRK